LKKKSKRKSKDLTKSKEGMASLFDVLGSYTGTYLAGEYEEPVQDADDL